MKHKSTVAFFGLTVYSVFAAGFGLYEMDAGSTAMGGHVFARPRNASANYYNPAGLSNLTGTWTSVGMTTLHPTFDTKVNGHGTGKMDPGCFIAPNAFVSQELPWGFTAGLGFYADYGLGSHYRNRWPLAWDSVESVFKGFTVNPNIAYKITDKWSVAGGVRLVHAEFEQRRYIPTDLSALGMGMRRMRMHMDLDNDVDVGGVLGTTYQVFDNFSVGAVYRSRVRLDLEGDSDVRGVPGSVNTPLGKKVIGDGYEGDISEKVDLPSSATIGFNWDIIEKLHMGASLTWTEWSTIDYLRFNLPAGMQTMDLRWHDAWRTGLGFAYDVAEDWTLFTGYTYDWDPTREKRPATMLPAGDRHIISLGVAWHPGNWELAAGYSIVLLESKTHYFEFGDQSYKYQTDNCYTHCVGITLGYRF